MVVSSYSDDRKMRLNEKKYELMWWSKSEIQRINWKKSNVRSQIMNHHQFMDQFRDCPIKCIYNYFLRFYLLLFDDFLNHWFMAQVQWNNYDTTIILFKINFWWDAKKITAAMGSIEQSMNTAMGWNWRSSVTVSTTQLEELLTGENWERGRTSLKSALELILFRLLIWGITWLIG